MTNQQTQIIFNFLNNMELLIKDTKNLLSDFNQTELPPQPSQEIKGGRFTKEWFDDRKNKKQIEENLKREKEEVALAEVEKAKTKIKSISITKDEKSVKVSSPYNSIFTEEAKILGGRWKDNQWVFDSRDQKEVEDLVFKVYGELYDKQNLVDLEVTYNPGGHHRFSSYSDDEFIITLFGQKIAAAKGRDSGAKLAPGIVLKSGKFTSSGSAKNWYTKAEADTTIVLRDISKQLVDEFLQEENNAVTIKIVAENSNVADREVPKSDEIDSGLLDD